jgi:hypothetical protein
MGLRWCAFHRSLPSLSAQRLERSAQLLGEQLRVSQAAKWPPVHARCQRRDEGTLRLREGEAQDFQQRGCELRARAVAATGGLQITAQRPGQILATLTTLAPCRPSLVV